MPIDPKFSRSAFETAVYQHHLAAELAAVLTTRLQAVPDCEWETNNIVAELRQLGHDIYHWDGSFDWDEWGDSWVEPNSKYRLIIRFQYPENGPPNVRVTFGLWPIGHSPAPPESCPQCRVPLEMGNGLVITVQGHGDVRAPYCELKVQVGDLFTAEQEIGIHSHQTYLRGMQCPECQGVWLIGKK